MNSRRAPAPEPARAATPARPTCSVDPEATSEALFKVVDADEPPLRLVLGSASLPTIRKVYADRLDTWEKWEAVSNAAQGSRKA
jgi:hypothetical protein